MVDERSLFVVEVREEFETLKTSGVRWVPLGAPFESEMYMAGTALETALEGQMVEGRYRVLEDRPHGGLAATEYDVKARVEFDLVKVERPLDVVDAEVVEFDDDEEEDRVAPAPEVPL